MQNKPILAEKEVIVEKEDTMFSHVLRLRNICGLCALVIAFHVVFTISLTVFSASNIGSDNGDINEAFDIVETNSYVSPQRVRKKRNILDVTDSVEALKSPEIILASNNQGIKRRTSSDDWHSNGLCQNGHAQDISTQCEAIGCLRKLNLPYHDMTSYLDGRVSDSFLEELGKSKGRLHRIHIDLVSLLTDIQWHNGIFGSVAVLGDNNGLMAKLLAINADISEGEKVFIAPDNLHNIQDYEFLIDNSLIQQNIHLCPGYKNFSKTYLIQKDIPQFRFVSISLQDNFNVLPHLIHLTTCIIREGGIVVLDNLNTDKVIEFVRNYFTANGEGTIKPLLATDNKLYFSSPKWKHIYTEKLLQSQMNFLSLHLQISKDNIFNSAYTYLSPGSL